MEQFGNQRSKENELRVAKEKELQKVQVKKEDIELIVSTRTRLHFAIVPLIWRLSQLQMNELLVTKAQAEKVLREQSGDVVAALEAIISSWREPGAMEHRFLYLAKHCFICTFI